MKKVKIVESDAYFDPSKLSIKSRLLLFPILVKIFGLWKATLLMYGRQGK